MIAVEKFSFAGTDGQRLDGRLEKPLYGPARAVALFAHCFTCTKQSRAATHIAAALAARGIAVLRFDFTGLGGSEGDFANAGFVSNVDDLVAAADALAAQGMAPGLLIGHSLGGAAVIAAASRIASARAVVTIGAPFAVDHVLGQLGDQLRDVEERGEAEVQIGGRSFRVARGFIAQAKDQPQARRLADLGLPLLVMHAPTDAIVEIDNARAIFQAALHPKSFIALDGADHLLTAKPAAEFAAAMIAPWFERYAPARPATPATTGRALEGLVHVETAGGKFAQFVRTATHEFIADEPEASGGEDDGPTPYDLLLAALGTCTSMTIMMYARRKGIALESVLVELEHTRDHARDGEVSVAADARIQALDRAIHLRGSLSEAERAKLMEIADRCPVHRTLEGKLHIHSTAVRRADHRG